VIDVTTCDHYGHWDVEDIRRLCEYRDRLKASLERIQQERLTWAMTCHPHECMACDLLDKAIRDALPQSDEQP